VPAWAARKRENSSPYYDSNPDKTNITTATTTTAETVAAVAGGNNIAKASTGTTLKVKNLSEFN
jgi:hypothetical protein